MYDLLGQKMNASAINLLDPAPGRLSQVEVRQIDLEAWQQFVEDHPDSTVFHHRHWIEALAAQYGSRCVILAALNERRIITAIPLLETRSLLGARKLVSLPFSDCVPLLWAKTDDEDSCASSGEDERCAAAWQALCTHLRSAAYQRYRAIVLRLSAPPAGVPSESHFFRHVIDLGRAYEAVRAGYSQGIRRNLKTAASKGLAFAMRIDPAAMDLFYDLHVRTRQKLGVPVQPKSFFQRLQDRVIAQGLGWVGLVMHGPQPAAAAVFLTFKTNMNYKFGASRPDLLDLRPNELLYDNAIRWAIERGFRELDLGVSDKDQDGLCAFKRKLGAAQSEAYRVFITGKPHLMMRQWRARHWVAGLIQRSPTFVCRGLGKLFYRYSQ